MNLTTVQCSHRTLSRQWIVVLNETVIEAFGLVYMLALAKESNSPIRANVVEGTL